MEIINKIDTEKHLTLETLNEGDVFIFIGGSSTPYMKCLDDCSDCYVDLATGDLYHIDCEIDFPVKKVKAKLIIEKEER